MASKTVIRPRVSQLSPRGKKGASAIKVIFLFVCFDQMGAALENIPDSKVVSIQTKSGEFKVPISEKGTKEEIWVDNQNGLEYFYVPANNGHVEADYLYDFKQNVSIRRDIHDSSCYLGPLPDKLPKPDILKTGSQRASQSSVGRKVTAQKYWAVSDQVNKTLLSQTVQHFCGQFPVYHLREFHFKSFAGIGKRSTGMRLVPLCNNSIPTFARRCNPQTWIYSLKVRTTHCSYWVIGCTFSVQKKRIVCPTSNHAYNNIVCAEVRCP